MTSRVLGSLWLVVGAVSVMYVARAAWADSSALCDSNLEVVASAIGLANPGGPDPDDPSHWEPLAPTPGDGSPEGFTCANVSPESCAPPGCQKTSDVSTFWGSSPAKRETVWWCSCADPEEGRYGACKVTATYTEHYTYNEDTEEWEWVLVGGSVACTNTSACDPGSCSFHVTTVGLKKIADCNCQ